MNLILLGSLTFILFQIIRSQNCIEADDSEYEQISISLSTQEVVQIPFNELSYRSASFIIYSDDKIDDVNQVEGMKIIEYVQHERKDQVKFLKQYKSTKSRMPRQSQMLIVQNQYIQRVKFYWDKGPEFHIFYQFLNLKLKNVEELETMVLINGDSFELTLENFPKKELEPSKQVSCVTPNLIDQLDNIIFSKTHHLIKTHHDWQKYNLCTPENLEYKCENEELESKQEINLLQAYQNQVLTFSSDNILITINLKSTKSECKSFEENILAYDYDMKTNKFVIVLTQQIQYDGEIFKLNLGIKQTQVFLTKKFIIFRYGTEITLFTRKLRLISTKDFKKDFQITANQLQDQFIMVDESHYIKYLLYEYPFFEINKKQNYEVSLMFEIQDKDGLKNIQMQIQTDYDNQIKALNISQTIEVSTIVQANLFLFSKCQYDEILMGAQQFHQYNKLSDIFSYKVRIFDLDSFKIIFAFSRSYIVLGQIEKGNLKQFKKYSISDEVINKQNLAFQIQDDKINYLHCTHISCYLYLNIMNTYDQKRAKKIENGPVQKVVSDNNHFYLLTQKEVLFYNLTETEQIQSENLNIKNVLDIFASPKKQDYLFVLTETGTLCLYSISFPFQDLVSSFSLNYIKILEFIIFEEYFLIFTTNSEQQTICNVYNYQNELNIFLSRKLPIFFFKQIDFDDLQVDYDKNILYIKGELKSSKEYAIVAYRIDTRIELSIQFITKLKSQIGFVLPISNSMTLRFENKFNFTSIYQNGDLKTTCLIEKFLNEDEDLDEDDSSSDSDSEGDKDDTLSLDESYQFSSSSFISISSAGELLILGMQSVYGRRRPQNIDIFQPL